MTSSKASNPGYVYILFNPSFRDNILKIGFTESAPEKRARKLSSTSGIPTDFVVAYSRFVSDCRFVERLIHESLANVRLRDKREFFKIPLDRAIIVLDRIVRRSFGLETWQGKHRLGDVAVRWLLQAGDYIAFLRCMDPLTAGTWTVQNIWEARDDGDQLVLATETTDDHVDGYLAEQMELRPGDRVVWSGKNRNAVTGEPDLYLTCIGNVESFLQVRGYSAIPRTKRDGFPILISYLHSAEAPEWLQAAIHDAIALGLPRVWA
jgi:hypothetical protein